MDGWTDGWMIAWMVGWMGVCTDGCMIGWMDWLVSLFCIIDWAINGWIRNSVQLVFQWARDTAIYLLLKGNLFTINKSCPVCHWNNIHTVQDYWLNDWLIDWLIDWLTDWLIGTSPYCRNWGEWNSSAGNISLFVVGRRTKGIITEPRDQMTCGSCWSVLHFSRREKLLAIIRLSSTKLPILWQSQSQAW